MPRNVSRRRGRAIRSGSSVGDSVPDSSSAIETHATGVG
jgi:hypothetical protein